MAPKDPRRADLIIPYVEPPPKEASSDVISTSLPMLAIFTRNRYMGWASLVFAIQAWLSENKDAPSSQPGYFSVAMALMSLVVTYLPLFMPPGGPLTGKGTGTGPAAAAPLQ